MAIKSKGDSSGGRKGKGGKRAKSGASAGKRKDGADQSEESARDAQKFVEGVVARGEAAPADEAGELPPGATHEVVGEDEEGRPQIVRRRFSAY
ncbi:MAG TPA: hypothetical protein VF507_05115 [Pyrinomonadaceae bacterium]|jgi:hypothetical protein